MNYMIALFIIIPPGQEPAPSPGDKVLEYARSMVGKQVGNGQCTDLVANALEQAGARRRTADGWGEPVEKLDEVLPGDILIFEDAVFVRRRRSRSGAFTSTTARMGNHAAIVSDVRNQRGSTLLAILHQNIRNNETGEVRQEVHEWFLNLSELRGGTVRAYRPVAPDAS
ncbi:hypothetical protein BH23PLA1_BH23PLA1_06580 [soil metagenome]